MHTTFESRSLRARFLREEFLSVEWSTDFADNSSPLVKNFQDLKTVFAMEDVPVAYVLKYGLLHDGQGAPITIASGIAIIEDGVEVEVNLTPTRPNYQRWWVEIPSGGTGSLRIANRALGGTETDHRWQRGEGHTNWLVSAPYAPGTQYRAVVHASLQGS